MCGFAGVIDTSGTTPADTLASTVAAMAETLRHRGPDDGGTWVDETTGVALAFRRLAILDLTQAGHQPQLSHDGRFVLVFNGEIYNHLKLRTELATSGQEERWAGHSDTETLLACFSAWGVEATLRRTVGMFAIALWDRRERQLHLALDRFAEKPLYYGWTRGAFVFGSELKALRRYPGFDNAIDPDVLAVYSQFAYVPAPYSIYERLYKVQPACVLTLLLADAAVPRRQAPVAPARDGGLRIERYWSLPEVVERGQAAQISDDDEAIERLEAALSEAVRLQSIADVPLGAFLSGGIDSSLIVSLMQAQSTRKVKTFTIGFDETHFNEAVYAKAVARHLGTDHEELYVSPSQARDVIPTLPDVYDEPFADSSQIPTCLVSQIARRHVTVALSGDAGDEVFGGYPRYLWSGRVQVRLHRLPRVVKRAVAAAIQTVPMAAWDVIGGALPGRTAIARLGEKTHKLAYRLRRVNRPDDLYRMLVTSWPADAPLVRGARPLRTALDVAASFDVALGEEHRMMLLDAMTYLPGDVLQKVDRASMAVSLETRVPYLDHRVVELAWQLPLRAKIRDGTTKWILRELLYRRVPRELIERPKMGFSVPIDQWLRGPLREWAEALLDERRLESGGFFNPAPIRQKWAEHLSGSRNWQSELWCILMFQAWIG